jgi:glycosyltransferase involved in cell wall biosynthesis
MVILHVAAPGPVGGLERVVQMLAAGHRARGHTVAVAAILTHRPDGEPFLEPLRQAGVEAHAVTVRTRDYFAERAAVAQLCQRLGPDVVHTHGYRPDVVDAGVARRLGLPVVTTVHGFTGGGWKNRLYEVLQRRAFRRFDAVVAVSRQLAGALARDGVPPDRIHVLPNAWIPGLPPFDRATARRTLGLPMDGACIGWVGRLSHEKGPDLLIAALPLLSDLPVAVSFVGSGKAEAGCRRLTATLGVGDRVKWLGATPDAGRLMRAFDVLVLSSRTEGTPIVLFEAMGASVPVVATRVGGVPDVLGPTEALLVTRENPGALAGAIRDVLTHPTAAAERAQAARARLERDFAPASWLARHEALYERVGAQAPARAAS